MLVTQTGVGKYKAIQKKGGNVLEWTTCIMDCGYTSVCIYKFIRIMQILIHFCDIILKKYRKGFYVLLNYVSECCMPKEWKDSQIVHGKIL